ncbi:MAG: hypothetical protein WD875_07330, partial [Pirellulales bacterium]
HPTTSPAASRPPKPPRALITKTILATIAATTFAVATLAITANAQVVLTGRVEHPKFYAAKQQAMLSTVLAFAAPEDPRAEPAGFRTWETEPAGWYRLSAAAGRYTLLFTQPAHYVRPFIVTNVFTRDGDKLDRRYSPRFDYFNFDDHEYDTKAASAYYQTFVARGTSVTNVGFKLATDGVDGAGPNSQTMLLSIHERPTDADKDSTPDQWPQVGPTMPVVEVDCGGPKNYAYSTGWNSGEVPATPGNTYAVHLRPETDGGKLQAFWRKTDDKPDDKRADKRTVDCYRIAAPDENGIAARGYTGRELWMSVAGDGDGLLIPYNKRVHKQFETLTRCEPKWQQTYVASGRGLASIVCYAAVSGAQPPLDRQRIAVRVRQGGPDGPVVGIQRVAIGNGNYTGDASWGVFGTAFAPGEVPLTPGETYAIEMQSLENYETLHGFVNIKGQISNDKPGFNPYRKHARDEYPAGTAFLDGVKQDFDLDMQIVEYEHAATDWHLATAKRNLLENGDMQQGETNQSDTAAADPATYKLADWKTFAIDPATQFQVTADGADPKNRIARVLADSQAGQKCDGGFVQQAHQLDRNATYRLSVKVRASWPLDEQHQAMVGYDPTGQADDPLAKTIVWTSLPKLHGTWIDHTSDPIRPTSDKISIYLRGRTTAVDRWPMKADFDAATLRAVATGVPTE